MTCTFKHAICNEVFEHWPLDKTCASLRRIGYSGIEIAPFTLAKTPGEITSAERKRYRETIQDHGLTFAGLHWLMVSPPGLHVTTPDREVRERSWRHIADLIDLCGDLGDNGVMVFGSPKQRCTVDGSTRADATSQLYRRPGGCRVACRGTRSYDPGGSTSRRTMRRDQHS